MHKQSQKRLDYIHQLINSMIIQGGTIKMVSSNIRGQITNKNPIITIIVFIRYRSYPLQHELTYTRHPSDSFRSNSEAFSQQPNRF
jgi:uncharacterized protein YoaH (UPF0181 family)